MVDKLVLFLRSDACLPLLGALRRRVERGEPFTGSLRLAGLSELERDAVAELTGQSSRSNNLALDLAAFDQLIKDTGRFDSLLELIESAVGGPIENKRAAKRRRTESWHELWDWAAEQVGGIAARHLWLDELRRTGWLKARSHGEPEVARKLMATALRLLDVLPKRGVPLPVFASTHLNNAHALDLDHDLGRLMCRAIAAANGLPTPRKRSEFRRAWELVGIVPDELSVTVLVLNVPAIGSSLTDEVLHAHANSGEPCRLTFRQLRLFPPTIEPGNNKSLYVCENPSVIASAADQLGSQGRPLVCVEGQPNLAALRLLAFAVASGWRISYHGDFDSGGIRIANWLYEQFRFAPWRFDAAHYRQFSINRRNLAKLPPPALWDPELQPAMEAGGYLVEEEHCVDELLRDLRLSNDE